VQLDKYLKTLVQDLDKHVAICEEFPEYHNGKLQTPIPRRVSRVVTPGTLIDEEFVEQDRNNFLLSIHLSSDDHRSTQKSGRTGRKQTEGRDLSLGLAWIDISTGEFFVQTTSRASLSSALLRIGATEVVVSSRINLDIREEIAACLGLAVERLTSPITESEDARIDWWLQRLDQPLSDEERSQVSVQEMSASQQLFDYIDRHLLELKLKPMRPQRKEQRDTMAIDRSSIKGLELLKTARDGLGKGSLFNTVHRTVTKGGSRLLRERLLYPSITPNHIEHRLDLISAFIAAQDLHQAIVAHLRKLFDMHRAAQKFALGRGDAEDLLCLANTFSRMQEMVQLLEPYIHPNDPKGRALMKLLSGLDLEGPKNMSDRIRRSIDEPGVVSWLTHAEEEAAVEDEEESEAEAVNSNVDTVINEEVRRGSSTRLSGAKAQKGEPWIMQRNASGELAKLHGQFESLFQAKDVLQKSLQEKLVAPRLVLKFDTKYGHICQSPRTKGFNEDALEELGASMVGGLKTVKSFYLSEWTTLGRQMDSLEFDIRQEEQRIFQGLRQLVVENLVPLRQNASVMDELDVSTAFADLAIEEGWTRPIITTRTSHRIVGGRHATVKLGLQEKGQSFISNDLYLDKKERAWLITGPNMAGKSTFLRQNALITILAQIGCYVPAEYAEIGIVDKMFSRIGAADDLFRNESTFMVEMLETASILRDATDRSFVIMDEVGRGTAPEDGTAVAYASLYHLYHINKCRTLFATHFHDLADKTRNWPQLAQYCADLYEDDTGSFTFVHKLRRGVNRKSHALRVAKMAGLPPEALHVAQQMLAEREDDSVKPELDPETESTPLRVSSSA